MLIVVSRNNRKSIQYRVAKQHVNQVLTWLMGRRQVLRINHIATYAQVIAPSAKGYPGKDFVRFFIPKSWSQKWVTVQWLENHQNVVAQLS